jgi:hypothetical protein
MKKIDISTKKYPDSFATVDDRDYELVNELKWHAEYCNGVIYACHTFWSSGKMKKMKMHRFVMDALKIEEIDHRDGDGLNNQRCNLRICSRLDNAKNRKLDKDSMSGYKGVSWNKRLCKWQVSLRSNNIRYHLGLFTCLMKAAKAYDVAAIKHHGEFAKTNFPTHQDALNWGRQFITVERKSQ